MFWLGHRDSDYFRLNRMPLDMFVGRDPEELAKKQRILMTIELRFDARVMSAHRNAICAKFNAFCDKLKGLGQNKSESRALLETLTLDIARIAFADLPIEAATVTVGKPHRYGTKDGIYVTYKYRRPNAIGRGLISLADQLRPRGWRKDAFQL